MHGCQGGIGAPARAYHSNVIQFVPALHFTAVCPVCRWFNHVSSGSVAAAAASGCRAFGAEGLEVCASPIPTEPMQVSHKLLAPRDTVV
eukprot:COSAG02_NODE_1814_length_10782_cov_383.824862_7_plen_89_part_00